jgi:hypothetical protein
MITSLALGVLWTLQFIAYVVAGAIGDEFEPEIFITDVIAVVRGGGDHRRRWPSIASATTVRLWDY